MVLVFFIISSQCPHIIILWRNLHPFTLHSFRWYFLIKWRIFWRNWINYSSDSDKKCHLKNAQKFLECNENALKILYSNYFNFSSPCRWFNLENYLELSGYVFDKGQSICKVFTIFLIWYCLWIYQKAGSKNLICCPSKRASFCCWNMQ